MWGYVAFSEYGDNVSNYYSSGMLEKSYHTLRANLQEEKIWPGKHLGFRTSHDVFFGKQGNALTS